MSLNRRLNRLFRPSGRALIVALDHGLLDGPCSGLEDPAETLAGIVMEMDTYSSLGETQELEFDDGLPGEAGGAEFITGQERWACVQSIEAVVARHRAEGFSPHLTGSAVAEVMLPLGNHPITLTVTDDEMLTDSDVVEITVSGLSPRVGPLSDDFSQSVLDPVWTFVDPLGDGQLEIVGTGTSDAHVRLSVPEGTPHDVIAFNNAAPRIVQAVDDVDFELEIKFETAPAGQFALQGLVVEQDVANFTRRALAELQGTLDELKVTDALPARSIPMEQRALVVGGGIAGMRAALSLAERGIEVDLVERSPKLGGHSAKRLHTTLEGYDPAALIKELTTRISFTVAKVFEKELSPLLHESVASTLKNDLSARVTKAVDDALHDRKGSRSRPDEEAIKKNRTTTPPRWQWQRYEGVDVTKGEGLPHPHQAQGGVAEGIVEGPRGCDRL